MQEPKHNPTPGHPYQYNTLQYSPIQTNQSPAIKPYVHFFAILNWTYSKDLIVFNPHFLPSSLIYLKKKSWSF